MRISISFAYTSRENQNDPLFFDHLYSSYQASRQQQQQQAAAVDNHPMHNQQQWP